eukprot:CAMPEP_0202338470 /NCGR_PEP_ID=MMETSP1126-20121109/733_1 /ASSEMBLY_ACC=CAM_ASM_000457 /TAXON_ID=3047 /ORGANISM="Dunaliella tertiolecta, Strain CCMP1320" /LENGTH=74 /DNA_ID=CAMNT_0048928855 /DNA_START=272 /DNA_END=493 /DNA_ORIENTATION=-
MHQLGLFQHPTCREQGVHSPFCVHIFPVFSGLDKPCDVLNCPCIVPHHELMEHVSHFPGSAVLNVHLGAACREG